MHWLTDHPGLDRYLEDTETVDWQTPSVADAARQLTSELPDDRARILAILAFVRDEIAEPGEGTAAVACRASHVLRDRAGLRHARCLLLAALLRARGFPAAFGYQRLLREPPEKGHVLHGFVAVWLVREERWAPLDPCAAPEAPGEACPVSRPRWAREPDPEAGETTDHRLFARPLRAVLDVLSRAPDVARARAALPDSL